MSKRWTQVAVTVILVLAAALAVIQSYATRLRWGPDEPAHMTYLQSLALDGKLPVLADGEPRYIQGRSVTHEAQQPPLYYAVAAVVYRVVAHQPDAIRWRVLRFFNIFLGLLTLGAVWRLLRRVFPHHRLLPLSALCWVAFLPIFTYMTSVVNNDVFLMLLVAWLWCRIAIVLEGRAGRWDFVGIGALLGAAILTKQTGFMMAPVVVVAALWGGGGGAGRRLGRMLTALVVAAAIVTPWVAREIAVYGAPFVHAHLKPNVASTQLTHADRTLVTLSVSAKQTFLHAAVPWWVVDAHEWMEHYFFPMLAFGLIALLGLLLAAMDYWHGRGIETRLQMRLAALVVLAALTLAAGLMRYILFQDYTATEAGRYWLALWPGLGMLIMIGLWTIFSGERTGRYWVPLVVLALLGADIASVWWTGVFYQQWPWPGM